MRCLRVYIYLKDKPKEELISERYKSMYDFASLNHYMDLWNNGHNMRTKRGLFVWLDIHHVFLHVILFLRIVLCFVTSFAFLIYKIRDKILAEKERKRIEKIKEAEIYRNISEDSSNLFGRCLIKDF